MISLKKYEKYEGTYKHSNKDLEKPVNNVCIITPYRYVTGLLETRLNSQISCRVIIQVDHHVFGYHGRNILISKGSRIICDHTSPEKIGVTRLTMSRHRILLGGNRLEIYGLSSKAGYGHGRAGVGGAVDNRFWEKCGTALLLTGLSAVVQVGAKIGEGGSNDNSVTKTASDEFPKRFGEITASVLQQAVDIRPVITIS
jgi:type IV secretion system protein VirB10